MCLLPLASSSNGTAISCSVPLQQQVQPPCFPLRPLNRQETMHSGAERQKKRGTRKGKETMLTGGAAAMPDEINFKQQQTLQAVRTLANPEQYRAAFPSLDQHIQISHS